MEILIHPGKTNNFETLAGILEGLLTLVSD